MANVSIKFLTREKGKAASVAKNGNRCKGNSSPPLFEDTATSAENTARVKDFLGPGKVRMEDNGSHDPVLGGARPSAGSKNLSRRQIRLRCNYEVK